MNNYDYPFNRPGYWNGCVPPNENGTVIVRSADARNGEDANGEEDVTSLRNSPSESSLFFYHTDHLGSTNLVTQGLGYSQLRQAQEGVIAACYDSLGYSYIPMNHRDAKDIVLCPEQ